ncbi:histidine phosphatase family protein [Salipaludibacillus sp. HK11]|uniref:histidine phosphatase family protein n=1 Tax=Salipaludibacillus sp. HK11 TaxID=3394320 RepID=UPI0039FBC5BE
MGTYACLDLYLIRHGITKWNQEKRYLGHTDEPVVAERLEDLFVLKKELNELQFDEICTSDLRRCGETLAFLLPNKQYVIDERLREFHFGDWEGKTYDDLKAVDVYRQWLDDWKGLGVPNGESWKDFIGRVEQWKDELFAGVEAAKEDVNHRTVLAVTHGGVIRYLLSTLERSQSFWDWKITHGEGVHVRFTYEEERWKCNSLSVVPSQEKEKS